MSISIMVIVMSVVLVRHQSFNNAVLLRSQAYEIALAIREVQLSAVSVVDTGGGSNFRQRLGVSFDTANPDSYGIVRDADSDGTFEGTFGAQGKLDPRFAITEVVAGGTSGAVIVGFERPNFDARFYASGSEITPAPANAEITITLTSSADTYIVEVSSAGQVSVRPGP